MRVPASFFLLLAASGLPAAAQNMVGPPAPIVKQQKCEEQRPRDSEIVVCGESSENSPYRIPQQFRGEGLVEDRHISWDTKIRDLEALERFSNQNVGASGMSKHSRQVDCEWRVARQEIRGERPDCGKGLAF